jgi:Zn finger protein HypA/HybF involved in hydrogenase expression
VNGPTPYVELRCPACPWAEVCGPEAVAGWLRRARKLRARSAAEWDILHEVLQATAGQLACPGCGHVGLSIAPARDEAADWPGARPCSACGQTISEERLRAVPATALCAACQQDEERGRAITEIEYCPRCGAPMELRPAKGGGVARYVLVCTGSPPCRV